MKLGVTNGGEKQINILFAVGFRVVAHEIIVGYYG